MGTRSSKLSLALFSGCFVIATLLLIRSSPAQPQGVETGVLISVDGSALHQKIDGFGSGFGGFTSFERGHFDQVVPEGVAYKMPPELRHKLVQIAVKELGVSHLRMWIGRGVEEKNDNDDPHSMNWPAFRWEGDSRMPQSKSFLENRHNGIADWVEFLRQTVPLGLEYWIPTPGGMPGWLEDMIRSNHPNRFEEYAEWAAAHLLYLKRAGFEAPYWSMFNEPDVPSRGWKSADLWIPWIKATGRRFRKEGLGTKIMFPDSAGVFDGVEMVKGVMKDDEARSYIGALAYHHYRSSGRGPQPFLTLAAQPEQQGELFEKVTGGIRAMAELGRQYGLPTWQTETAYYPQFTKDLAEWEIGLARANEIYYELLFGASAVEGMSMIAPDVIDPRYGATMRHEGHHIVVRTDGQRVVRWEVTRDAGGVLAHYGKFVRPGDRMVGATSTDPTVRVTAFTSGKNRRSVAVVINNGPETRSAVLRLRNASFQPRHAVAVRSDAEHILGPSPVARQGSGNEWAVLLPGKSLSTFVLSEEKIGNGQFQRSGNVGPAAGRVFEQKRYTELRLKRRRGEKLTPEERDYFDWAEARSEEQNEIHRKTNPPRESTGLVPLTELGSKQYKGQGGGLYPGGKNTPPPLHLEAGLRLAREIVPRDKDGRADAEGKIVLLSIGMSNATMEFQVFKRLADNDPDKNRRLVIVDGAQGTQSVEITADPAARFWKVVDERLAAAGVTPKQVQAVWFKVGMAMSSQPFPEETKKTQQFAASNVHILADRFVNLKLAYLSSRIYGGFAEIALSPEPHAYQSGFAVKWLIEDQIAGKPYLNYLPGKEPVRSPWLAWGPYLWADGVRARSDGLRYLRDDITLDGIHPERGAREKVSNLLLAFFKNDPTARSWFARNGRAPE